jgi:hypothetical protein
MDKPNTLRMFFKKPTYSKAQQRERLKEFLDEEGSRAGMYLQGEYGKRFGIIRDNVDLLDLETKNIAFEQGFSEGDIIPITLAKILLENGLSLRDKQEFLIELGDPVRLLYLMVLGYEVEQADYSIMRNYEDYCYVPQELYDFLDRLKSDNFKYVFTESDYHCIKYRLEEYGEFEDPDVLGNFLEEMRDKIGVRLQ